jgi:hypothetical protein
VPLSPSLLILEPPSLNMRSAARPPIRKGGGVSFALRVGSCLALLPKLFDHVGKPHELIG